MVTDDPMARLEIFQFPYNADNYGVLIHCNDSGATACIDAGDAAATEAVLAQTGWSLTHIFITHHHADHTAGLAALKATHNAHVIGPPPRSAAISGIDSALWDGDSFDFANRQVHVMATPGHTTDMINFYLPEEKIVFTGDTLFALGCGRVFEGSFDMMWESLEKLLALPDDTVIYCSHEYTKANADFAVTIDPENDALNKRHAQIIKQRANNIATVPTIMSVEKATNPFLRPDDASIRAHLGMEDARNADVFAEIRRRKDAF
jgi:hydroxyacylglutathione hydrolase